MITKKKEKFLFLDGLRKSGVCNMYGATPYLMERYQISRDDAIKVLAEWMQTFDERHKKEV